MGNRPSSAALTLLHLVLIPAIGAGQPGVQRTSPPQGTLWRIAAPEGSILALQPRGYRKQGARIVLYVHGFNTTVERTWKKNDLAAQLTASRLNAIFIAVQGARSLEDGVKHPSLSRVLQLVGQQTTIALPDGGIVAVGHSGGYWTIASWLDHPRLSRVILLDGMYGFMAEYERWIGRPGRRLIFVARGTRQLSRRFLRGQQGVVTRGSVPARVGGFSRAERAARILHIDSQYGHSAIIRGRKVLPVVLGLVGQGVDDRPGP